MKMMISNICLTLSIAYAVWAISDYIKSGTKYQPVINFILSILITIGITLRWLW